VSQWLAGFGDVLERRDTAAAVEMFEQECYWRDLVAFTWNIVTVEGQESIEAMLDARLGDVQPLCWLCRLVDWRCVRMYTGCVSTISVEVGSRV